MNFFTFLSFATFTLTLSSFICSKGTADVINFDELSLNQNSFFDGYGPSATGAPWNSNGVQFNTGQFTGGWSYSNVDDTTTAGFTNQWASITGEDFNGNGNYALANSLDPNSAYFNLPVGQVVESIFVTNSTYAALSMRDGDSFAKQFGGVSGDDEDFFKVIFTGFDQENALGSEVGSVEFFLADYRFQDNSLDYILDQWQQVNLTSLQNARSIGVSFDGSDVGAFGLNTPAYVVVDELTIVPIPEPNSAGVILCCLLLSVRRSGRKQIRN